jgi:ribosomal protein L29
MSIKKKNKIRKLTDEEYEQYIMALKDETPPRLVKKTQE